VKSGGVTVKDVRDLRGVIEREKAEIGVLIYLDEQKTVVGKFPTFPGARTGNREVPRGPHQEHQLRR